MAEPLIRLETIHKVYGSGDSALPVLHDVDLAIHQGEFVGLIGASGSGKTTLMNIIGCLDRPTEGSYFLEGDDISGLDDRQLSRIRNRRIGFVFQSFNLIAELTVLENVEVPLFYNKTPGKERHGKCLKILEAVGLSHRVSHVPSELSGGECQRVAIARSLVNDPSLVLADEPTGNLDSRSGAEILKLFNNLHADGRSILMVTHNLEIAANLPRVVELKDGRVLADRKADGFRPSPADEFRPTTAGEEDGHVA